ncbi:cell wall protein DAN4-like [Lytechinus variegatus]|uniref:cell wall protein DAN4-like n=1 Tax=Lytechinus variegatus TaxID=7654 RepID=UPI001BB27DF5|nr:cell wall protein DAN4-like [Lytechinus variegatus]
MTDLLDHDASIIIACNIGYSTGMGIVTELMCDNGTLSAPVPICYENCDVDAIPFSNQTTSDSLDHDARLVVACNIGYSTGMGTLTELMCDNGTLSAPVPICYVETTPTDPTTEETTSPDTTTEETTPVTTTVETTPTDPTTEETTSPDTTTEKTTPVITTGERSFVCKLLDFVRQ